MRYALYYWPTIPGRGEFVRLALEEAGVDYIDVAQGADGPAAAVEKMQAVMGDESFATPPFAPPFLKAGSAVIAQVANILFYLGVHHGLSPQDEAGRLWVHQLQLTLADWVVEIHDTHHPLGPSLYYAEQKAEAKRRTTDFLSSRLPKYLGYFERVLERNPVGGECLAGNSLTYADLSLFLAVTGLRYAFPKSMKRLEPDYPLVAGLVARVGERPRIAAYLSSPRHQAFNEDGIFRHYPELDT
ncbi:MAG: glutathione S-transferase family protein [Gammaproteobacteria bacterium]